MTRDDAIRMAREAGVPHTYWGDLSSGYDADVLIEFAALVAAAEREACARVCEKSDRHRGPYFADKIRARGEK